MIKTPTDNQTNKLEFGLGNAKLPKWIAIFDLPAGHSCPFARDCRSSAHRETGKITDGPDVQFRCYAASAESRPAVRAFRWRNFDALKGKTTAEMVTLISAHLPWKKSKMTRIHTSGDFFSQSYFDAWLEIARQNPERIFYAYTKAVALWVARLGQIPANFRLTASHGGTHDHLIAQHGLRSARVVHTKEQADALGLEVDHTDAHAWGSGPDFALLIHGTQPAGTPAAKAWNIVRKAKGGYNKARQAAHALTEPAPYDFGSRAHALAIA